MQEATHNGRFRNAPLCVTEKAATKNKNLAAFSKNTARSLLFHNDELTVFCLKKTPPFMMYGNIASRNFRPSA